LQPPFYLDQQQVIQSRTLDQFPWMEHGFGTRLSQNWPPRPTVTAKQIHSARVLLADGQNDGVLGEGDAIIVSQPGTLAAIRTADCLPILIADPIHRVAAAVHAGWRGTVAQIASATVGQLSNRFDTRPRDLIALIGPGIQHCCFEVGAEVASQLGNLLPERKDLQERTRISLAEANRRQLIGAGILPHNVQATNECTCCNPERFESFRRDREASRRMVSVIGLRP
jgi:YfiH family protein